MTDKYIKTLPDNVRLELAEYTAKQFLDGVKTGKKELISKIEKMKWSDELDDKYEGEEIRRKVHNQALDDVIKLIREE